MTNLIDKTTLAERMQTIHARSMYVLEAKGEDVKPQLADTMFELGREIFELTTELDFALTAHHVLYQLTCALSVKARDYARVFGTTMPDPADFAYSTGVSTHELGIDVMPKHPAMDDEDLPF